jgi:hypothetical protein
MADDKSANISPARMIADIARISPLSRESYLTDNFKGLPIRVEGTVIEPENILHAPYATVALRNEPDGARILANFTKPLSPEVKQLRPGDYVIISGVVFNVASSLVLDGCVLVESKILSDATAVQPRPMGLRAQWLPEWLNNLVVQVIAGLICGIILLYLGWRFFH